MNKWLWYILIGGFVAGAGGLAATNTQIQQKISQFVTPQYMLTTNPQQVPDAVVCNVPINHMSASTISAISNNPEQACLGGLTLVGGAPIFGDDQQQTVTSPASKYANDLYAAVANDVLICQVPCSNIHAQEIQWCNDLKGPQLSYTIRAQRTC